MTERMAVYLNEIEARLRSDAMLERVRALGDLQRPFADTLRDSLGEARHLLSRLSLEGAAGKRVLEVGAGLGIVSACLEKNGILVEAVEPAATAFDDNRRLLPLVRKVLQAKFVSHTCAVHELSPEKNGRYEFIISHNVLEHMAELERSFQAMGRLLTPGGEMRHSCPNYFVPYEPHYGVWLVPFFPQVTPFFSRKLREEPLVWRSLNFITAKKIRRLAAQAGCSVHFEKGTMYEALVRTGSDPAFASRQSGWPSFFRRWLKKTALLSSARHFPAQWATPMTVHLRISS